MKKRAILSFVVFLLGFTYSQTVSNFSGEDIHGGTHDLFEYLDAGKYVVIKFTQTQ